MKPVYNADSNQEVFLHRPLLLTDFLMNSYNVGGSISLLALNGVFSLIQNHNLVRINLAG